MPGGPIPKHPDQRRRRNQPDVPTEHGYGAAVVEVPTAKRSWHPIAKRWYESLAESGQAQWYEPSDWATAFVIAESMSRDLRPKVVGVNEQTGMVMKESVPMNGAALSAYIKAMGLLLVTEGDRRRARIQLERPPAGDDGEDGGSVSWLDESRRGRSPG